MLTDLFALARAVHFGACLLLFGWLTFAFVSRSPWLSDPEITSYARASLRRSHWFLFPIILLSGIAWFVLVTLNMGGPPFQIAMLKTVWHQTQFGITWQCRSLLWLATTLVAVLLHRAKSHTRNMWLWMELCLAGALLGSLAWAGHGRESSGWHLFADVLHLLVAGVWPAGLLPLFLLLRQLRRHSASTQLAITVPLISRFSAASLISVALLSATGLANSWFLVGSVFNLFSQTYGHWLLLKLGLFLATVAIGAINLLYLKPRLPLASTAAQLRRNVLFEILLATGIIIIVAILGILPPAIQP